MNVFELMATLSLDSSAFDKGLTAVGTSVGKGMKIAGAAIGTASVAVAAFCKSAINTGMEFDASMSQIAATLGFTGEAIEKNLVVNGENAGDAFDALRAKALEMGSQTMYSAQQSAEGLNILSMAGFNSSESISMIEDVLHLAAAGSMELGEAASYVSGNLKGFASEGKDAQYYADLMAKGATLANTSVSELGAALSGAAATASSYGQQSDGVTLALLRLANQNVTGTAATTALNRAMADLYTPTDGAAAALRELGVSAYEASGEARDVNAVMDDLTKALSGMTAEQKNAYLSTIFTAQGLGAFNKMTAASEEEVQKWKDGIADAAGSASDQYATMTDNLQGDITAMGSAFEGLQIAVSDKLTPSMRDFVQFATNGLSSITEGFRANGIKGAMDALGTLVADGAAMLIKKIPDFISAAGTMISAFGRGIMDNKDVIIESFTKVIVMAKDTLTGIDWKGVGITVWNLIVNGVTAIGSWLGNKLLELGNAAVEMFKAIDWKAVGSTVLNYIVGGIQSLGSWLADTLSGLGSDASSAFSNINWHEVGAMASQFIINGLNSLASIVVETLGNIGTSAYNFFSNIDWIALGSSVINFIVDGFNAIADLIGSTLETIGNAASDLFEGIDWAGLGISVINFIVEGIGSIAYVVASTLQGLGESAMEAFNSIDWLSLGTNIVNGIINGISSLAESAVSAVTEIGSNIVSGFKGILGIHSPSTVMKEAGEDTVQGLVDGLNEDSSEAMSPFENLASWLSGWGATASADASSAGSEIVSGLSGKLNGLSTTGMAGFTGMQSQMAAWGKAVSTLMSKTGKEMVDKLKSSITKLPTLLNPVFNQASAKTTSFATNFIQKMKQGGTQAVTNFVSALSSMAGRVGTLLASVTSRVSGWGSSITSQFRSIGANVISGMISGMSSMMGSLYSSIYNNMSGMVQKAKDTLGVASPSKVFKKIAEWCVRGFEIGISALSDVTTFAGDIESAISPLRGGVAVTMESSSDRVLIEEIRALRRDIKATGTTIATGVADSLEGMTWKSDGRELARMVRKVRNA